MKKKISYIYTIVEYDNKDYTRLDQSRFNKFCDSFVKQGWRAKSMSHHIHSKHDVDGYNFYLLLEKK